MNKMISNAGHCSNTDFSGKYYIEDFKLARNDEFKIREALFKYPVASTSAITSEICLNEIEERIVFWCFQQKC